MIIHTVEYAGTVVRADGEIPGDLPQIAFSGRSNVGKSSLINTLLRRTRSKVARVSATPGKTQALNFYEVNGRFFLLDLPGFGYAKVPKSMRDSWKDLIEGYLARDVDLRGVVHLVDARHDPTPQDFEMLDFLATLGLPTLVVLTKVDKLRRHQRTPAFQKAAGQLGIDLDQLLPFSSKTGEGRDLLLSALDLLLDDEPTSETIAEDEVESDDTGAPADAGAGAGADATADAGAAAGAGADTIADAEAGADAGATADAGAGAGAGAGATADAGAGAGADARATADAGAGADARATADAGAGADAGADEVTSLGPANR